MLKILTNIFTWWNKATTGTYFFTWRKGELVGTDDAGNKYYRARVAPLGERRWVIYANSAEASSIPSGWHGWMHHTIDIPPSAESYLQKEWEKPHSQNMTGTTLAYRPTGSILAEGQRPAATGDYDAWSPSDATSKA